MKTSLLGSFAAAALLAITVTACAGPAAPANDSSASATPTVSATSTPTPVAKAYTSAQLAAIVRQLRDAADRRLTIMPETELAATLEQAKEAISAIDVAPAECKEYAASSSLPAVDGAAMAMGVSTDTGTGAVTALSLLSGLDDELLAKVTDPTTQLQTCANMTMSVAGMEVPVTITTLDGVSGLADTTAYRTESRLPNGQVQSVITAQAVQQGVVLTAVASGGTGDADSIARAGALLDSAAALVR